MPCAPSWPGACRTRAPGHGPTALQSELGAALEADREFLRRCNRGSEAMQQVDQLRVRVIRHASASGATPRVCADQLLSAEEMENLTIRLASLIQAERDTINCHIVATTKMCMTLPGQRHLKNACPRSAGATTNVLMVHACGPPYAAPRCPGGVKGSAG